jgi:D-amino-acid dehydrogenase
MAEALASWRDLLGAIGRTDLLIESGHLVVWNDPAAARRGSRAWLGADLGPARCRLARADELAPLAALLGQAPAGGVAFENTAQMRDLGELLAALSRAFVAAGGERRRVRVTRLVRHGGAVRVEGEEGASLPAARVVVAAGVRSGELLRPLGLAVPLIAERGYHIQSADHDWPEGMPPVVFEERATILTRFTGGLRAASFVELTHADAPPDERCWQRLERTVAGLGVKMRGPFARWYGCRPTLPDYLPAIGRAAADSPVFYAFGHQHLGLTLAAVTARRLAAMLTAEAPAPAAFSLARFQ